MNNINTVENARAVVTEANTADPASTPATAEEKGGNVLPSSGKAEADGPGGAADACRGSLSTDAVAAVALSVRFLSSTFRSNASKPPGFDGDLTDVKLPPAGEDKLASVLLFSDRNCINPRFSVRLRVSAVTLKQMF